jgi:hypothetical protein
MKPFVALLAAAALCGASPAALASPLVLVFSGKVLTFNKSGAPAGKAGDPFSGKIVFDLAKAPSAVQNDNGTIRATAGAGGGCAVYVNGDCKTDTGAVPPQVVLYATVSTTLGDYAFLPATDGGFTESVVSRLDATANGGAQDARYTLGNANFAYDAAAAGGYRRTTFNQLIGLDLTAAHGGLFGNAANLGGDLDTSALTSGLFTFSSTQIRAQCTDIGLFSCGSGTFDGPLPQVDLIGTIGSAYVTTPGNVPEPGGIALIAAGAAALVLGGRRRVRS